METHKMFGLAQEKGATFLLASTSEVYGDPLVHPQKEEYWGNVNSIGPRSVYDEAKRYAKAITMAYHRTHGLDTPIVRIFNTTARPWRLRMNTEPLRRFSMTKKSLPIIWLMGRTWRQRRPA